jgi:outer membrane protein TolC
MTRVRIQGIVRSSGRSQPTVLADQTLLDITRETLNSQNESYALTQRLFSAGTTTELALRQAETTVETARANLARVRAAPSPEHVR